ncbi:MAG: hypothetical protein ACRD35_00040 [Candidatus Acidiferrales bacterium]
MPPRVHLALSFLLLLFALPGRATADELERQRERLTRAADAGERAKITVKIGEELLNRVTKAYKDANSPKAAEWLAAYRDAIQSAGKGLLDSRRQEPRQLKGFKDLEIHLRKGNRHLREIEHLVPLDEQEALETLRGEMDSLRQELLSALMEGKREQTTAVKEKP